MIFKKYFADLILLLGTNPSHEATMVNARIKKAHKLNKTRIYLVLKTILKAKYIFHAPTQKDLLIFDGESLHELKNVLHGFNYFVLEVRLSRIKNIYITKKIIFSILKNFKNNIFSSYLLAVMDELRPKVVFTFIDNSFRFSEFSALRQNQYKFVALQNGARYEHKIFNYLLKNNFVSKDHFKFNIPNFFCFGDNEIKDYKKNKQIVKNFTKVGSLRLSNFLYSNKLQLKSRKLNNDILLISDIYCWDLLLNKTNLPIEEGVAKLIKFNIKFAIENDVKFKLATRNFKNSFETEKNFYKKILNKEEFKFLLKNLLFRSKNYETYKKMTKSKIVIGTMSTLLRENMFIGGKSLSCNFTGTNIFDFPISGLCFLKNCDYLEFNKTLKYILRLSYKKYLLKINRKPNYIIYKDKKETTISLVRSKLKSFLE